MEITMGQRLMDSFHLLKNEWPTCEINAIDKADNYYTDGMATDSIFKIQFYQAGLYLTSIYVKNDGTYYQTIDNILIKKIISKWVNTVKGNSG